jgi:hypothetical protein
VAVGIGTVLVDDPLLTACEVDVVRQPTRVVFDPRRDLLDSQLVRTVNEAPLVVVTDREPRRLGETAEGVGAELDRVAGRDLADRVATALAELGRRVTSLMLEGGRFSLPLRGRREIDELRLSSRRFCRRGDRLSRVRVPAVGEGARLALRASHGDDVLIRARLRSVTFTGLIEDVGTAAELRPARTAPVADRHPARRRARARDSVAVNGVRLTAVEADRAGFATEAMNQTLRLTPLGPLQPGDQQPRASIRR